MSDSTARLKIPELVSMQEANAATWNEALVQLDVFVDLYLLGQYANTPPSSPADGDAYLTGASPTGAWSGYAYKIASCLDGAWRFYTPFNGLKAYVAGTGAFIVYAGGTWTSLSTNLSAAETSIASATTSDLGAAGALFIQIAGNTTITSFGTGANKLCFVRYAQALTLTHNATSLILLGGASRTTAANDVGIYTSDASGNWRERSYYRAAANPGDYATKSGTETLSGKTFSGATNFPASTVVDASGYVGVKTNPAFPLHVNGSTEVDGNLYLGGGVPGNGISAPFTMTYNSANTGAMVFNNTASGAKFWMVGDGVFSSAGLFNFYNYTNSKTILSLDGAGPVRPGADNTQTLGAASFRWSVVYAGTGTINTSGAATKTNGRALSEAEAATAKALAANVRVFQFCDAVVEKGDAARLHTGMIYEDVVAAFAAQGLDPERYGIVCRDADKADPEKSVLGLRYDELAQFVMAGLNARIAALEAK